MTLNPETICSQARRTTLVNTAALVPPLAQSAAFVLDDVPHVERVYSGEEAGFTYGREGHPNARDLAARIARLESTEAGQICSSGMGAIAAVLASLLQTGLRVVASHQLYGRTTTLLGEWSARLGVSVEFVDTCKPVAVERALSGGARLLLFETVSNPLLRVADVARLAELGHAAGAIVVVDNTFPTPLGFRPAEHGADLVVHSVTKLLAGHSDVTLGVVCGRQERIAPIERTAVSWGFAASPFECWLADRGLATLPVRLERSTSSARRLADFLASHAVVGRVYYPGRSDHPDHDVAARQFGDRHGNMVAFELKGGRDQVDRFFHALQMVPLSLTLGHHATLAMHPASASHRSLSPHERAQLGITEGLVRVSVGLEHPDDLETEFARAFRAVE
jgi:cystathionine gamma-synthase